MGNARKLYELAVRLFPEGPPTAGEEWVVGANCAVEDYVYLLGKLFKKNGIFTLDGCFTPPFGMFGCCVVWLLKR